MMMTMMVAIVLMMLVVLSVVGDGGGVNHGTGVHDGGDDAGDCDDEYLMMALWMVRNHW